MVENFCKYCILQGGEIFPLNVSADDSAHLGICNPSIFDDGEDVYLTLRNVNYMLYQNINKKFQTRLGELVYCVPDEEGKLITRNYLAKYDLETNKVIDYKLIDTTDFDVEPKWEFIGHEDVRLVRWNGKLYVTGCRRDVKDNGESRMELCEIDPITGKELSRLRIKAPGDNTSYCEKNWMPIIDMPFHYVKWSNPVEVVKVNPENGDCETVLLKEQDQNNINTFRALRGSSQVIPYKDGYIALTHEVDLYLNELDRKECNYYMKWVVYDKEFNIVKTSDEFHFLGFRVEFTNGLMYKNNTFYIPFAVMDGITFMLKVSSVIVDNFIDNKIQSDNRYDYVSITQENNIYKDICLDNNNPEVWFNLGEVLYEQRQFAQASTCYARSLEENVKNIDDLYKYVYSLAASFSEIGNRDILELSFWENCINLDSSRSEGFVNLARYYKWRGDLTTAYMFVKLAYELNNYKPTTRFSTVNRIDGEILYYELMYYCEDKNRAEWSLDNLRNYIVANNYNDYYLTTVCNLIQTIRDNKEKYKKVI